MNKKEKIICLCFILSFLFLMISNVYTLYQNKPKGHKFKFEQIIKKVKN